MAVWPLRLRRMFCLCVVAQASLLPRHLLGDKSGERERERERKRKYEQLAARIVSEIDHPTPVRCDEEKKNWKPRTICFSSRNKMCDRRATCLLHRNALLGWECLTCCGRSILSYPGSAVIRSLAAAASSSLLVILCVLESWPFFFFFLNGASACHEPLWHGGHTSTPNRDVSFERYAE